MIIAVLPTGGPVSIQTTSRVGRAMPCLSSSPLPNEVAARSSGEESVVVRHQTGTSGVLPRPARCAALPGRLISVALLPAGLPKEQLRTVGLTQAIPPAIAPETSAMDIDTTSQGQERPVLLVARRRRSQTTNTGAAKPGGAVLVAVLDASARTVPKNIFLITKAASVGTRR